MTFEQILELLNDTTKTRYQLAADIHALISKASKPSALDIKPKQERKKREAKGTKPAAKPESFSPLMNGADDHGEAH